jgi:hypothetical protein
MLISMRHDNPKITVITWNIHHDAVEFGKTD